MKRTPVAGGGFNLLDSHDIQQRLENPHAWKPQPPPSLSGVDEIELDCETNGLRWWAGDRPVGLSLRMPDGSTQYLPWGHKGGGNLDEGVVRRWAQTELVGKRITNLNIKFDVHMLRAWGVDLEAQGNTVADVGHMAALLDDHRQRFSLEAIGQDWLGEGKHQGLDKTRMAEYHAGEVAAYAEQDVALVGKLKAKMWPELTKQDLHRVRALEEKVIYPVCEMEKNGSPLNVPLLHKMVEESEQAYLRCLWQLRRETGVTVDVNKTKTKIALFEKLGLDIPLSAEDTPTFKDTELKHIDHPIVQLYRKAN